MIKDYIESQYHVAFSDLKVASDDEKKWEARKSMAKLEQLAAEKYGLDYVDELRKAEGLEQYRSK